MIALLLACGTMPAFLGLASASVAADFLLQSRDGIDAERFTTYNAAPVDDSLGLWDGHFGAAFVNPNGFRIVVSIGADGFVDQVRPYGTTGNVTIPAGGYVVQASGDHLPILAGVAVNDPLRVRLTTACCPNTGGVPAIMYHDITSGPAFEAHLQSLSDQGYEPISLEQLHEYLAGANDCAPALPGHPILITFDDAYVSHFALAANALEQFGMVGTFFVITSYPDVQPWVATWHEIEDRAAEHPGVVELACHSHNAHTMVGSDPKYLTMSSLERQTDLEQCHDTLLAHTGVDTTTVAWPFGGYDEALLDDAAAVGFDMMLSTWPGVNDPANDEAATHVRRYGASVATSWATVQSTIDRWYVCPP